MNNVVKFLTTSALPLVLGARQYLLQELMGAWILAVDLTILVLLVCAAGYVWSFTLDIVRGISLRVMLVIVVVWLAAIMSYLAFLMLSFIAREHPNWSYIAAIVMQFVLPDSMVATYSNWTTSAGNLTQT